MSIITDTHTHSWSSNCHLAGKRRYTPTQAHTIDMLLSKAENANVQRIVLVQPSFLGTDNSYILEQLNKFPSSLRGVVVVDHTISEHEFKTMADLGVKGVRLNILGSSCSAKELIGKYRELFYLLKKYQCHLEIQTKSNHWKELMPELIKLDIQIVVDHFGLPESQYCGGFNSILQHIATGNVWVKLSAPYRFKVAPSVLAKKLIDMAPHRLIWGSDYPWTQHEEGRSYTGCLKQLEQWCGDKYLDNILDQNPNELFGFCK